MKMLFKILLQKFTKSFVENYNNIIYLKERAIITPTNEIVDDINMHLLSLVPSEEHVFLSIDIVFKTSSDTINKDVLCLIEFLNSLKFHGAIGGIICPSLL